MFGFFATKVTQEMHIWILLLAMVTFGCRVSHSRGSQEEKPVTRPALSCTHEGVVKDLTGLDGCGLMIELPQGQRLEPASLPDSTFTLRAGQRIRFSYKPAPDMMSVCMGGQLVHITCIALR